MPPSPNFAAICAALCAIIVACLVGHHVGYGRGVTFQKVEDQKQFDKLNADLAKQKADAGAKYKALAEQALASAQAADKFKNQLEVVREKSRTDLDAYRRSVSGSRLFFDSTQAPGCGHSSGSPQSGAQLPTSPDATSRVELPPTLREALRELMDIADDVSLNYRACYGWAHRPTD